MPVVALSLIFYRTNDRKIEQLLDRLDDGGFIYSSYNYHEYAISLLDGVSMSKEQMHKFYCFFKARTDNGKNFLTILSIIVTVLITFVVSFGIYSLNDIDNTKNTTKVHGVTITTSIKVPVRQLDGKIEYVDADYYMRYSMLELMEISVIVLGMVLPFYYYFSVIKNNAILSAIEHRLKYYKI
ncbi:MAG: hypothetical protein ACE3JK_01745 [Sporolactobacillus sp.]